MITRIRRRSSYFVTIKSKRTNEREISTSIASKFARRFFRRKKNRNFESRFRFRRQFRDSTIYFEYLSLCRIEIDAKFKLFRVQFSFRRENSTFFAIIIKKRTNQSNEISLRHDREISRHRLTSDFHSTRNEKKKLQKVFDNEQIQQ